MVDKNVAFNRDGRSEEFAENDPLAELARIVGYEDRPRHVSPQAASVAGAQQRRDPSFNLEDELLREFAIYDAPQDEARVAANDAVIPAAEPIHANDFLQRVEDVFARREPEFFPQPVPNDQDDFQITEAPIGDALRYTMNAQPQSYGEENYHEPQAYAPVAAEQATREPQYHEPIYNEPVYEEPSYQAAQAYAEPNYQEPVDLSYEVEQSLVEEPVYHQTPAYTEPNYAEPTYVEPTYVEPVYEPAPVVAADPNYAPAAAAAPRAQQGARSSLEFSSMRQPLGNFSMSRATPFIPKAAPVSQTPVHVPVHAEPIMAPTPAPSTKDQNSDLDALIADVSRYSIGTNDRNGMVSATPVSAHQEPVAAAKAEPSFDLSDDAFEAALDDMDFEFDLSDIDLAESAKSHAAAAAVTAPMEPVAPQREVPSFLQRPQAPQPATVSAAAPSYAAPIAKAPVAAAPSAAPASLPFDLDQIGDTDDQPEALGEFDVPELPPLAIEPKVTAQRHDDDLDLDTELAALFTPSNTGFDRQRGGVEKSVAAQPAPKAPDVDEFERALEEDFRRSLQENPTKPTKIQATPSNEYDDYEVEGSAYGEARSAKRWMMPAVAAIGALVVVGGVYAAFFSNSTVTGADGQPIVIAADSEPMKVVPAEPGGRVVPNQDKAVYDRVAGNASADPKQPALISSDEAPVDVVQHTLIPEQVAIDDEGDFPAGAEALDTVDPRLLPAEEQGEAAAETPAEAPVNVSPRRVRTMIVKPDGTLVAQEVDAPSAAPAPAPVATPSAPTPAPVVAQTPAPAPAPVAEAPAPAPVATTNTASAGGYYIQIASLPSDAEAQKTYKTMSSKFGSVIGGRGVDIKRAEIAGKGTYYRVRIPAGDRAEANALCQRFQSAGGSCLVTR